MMKKQFGRFILGICMMLFIAACAPLDMSTEELTARIQESMDSEINVHLVQETHFVAPEGAESGEPFGPDMHIQEMWMRDSEHSRHELRSVGQSGHDAIFIRNGDRHIMLDLVDNSYMTVDMMEFGSDESADEAEQPSAAKMIANAIENLDITYLGAEEVAGRMTYKVAASYKEDASDDVLLMGVDAMTMWVDQETFYPLQTEYDAGGGMTVFDKAILVEFGVEMPDELFLPPAGAVEVDSLPGMPEQMTLEEAEAKAGFDVLSLPESDEFRLESAMVMSAADFAETAQDADGRVQPSGDGFDVTLMYNVGRNFLHINQSSIEWPEMSEGVEMPEGMPIPESVTVRGHEGEMMNHFGWVDISWTENGIRFNIGGPNLSLEELLELAESLE